MATAILTQEGFERAIRGVLEQAYAAGRGSDVERIVSHVEASDSPSEVSQLAALMYLVDEEYRLRLQESIEAYRRWCNKKSKPASDSDIIGVLRSVYATFKA